MFFLKSEKSKIRILEHWSYDRIRIRIISWRWRYRPVYCIICWLVSESALKSSCFKQPDILCSYTCAWRLKFIIFTAKWAKK